MKKHLFSVTMTAAMLLSCVITFAQTRYVDDIFTDVLVTSNIEYDTNRSINILYGLPGQLPVITASLKCDIYTPPATDTENKRPVVIIAHTGSFLPEIVNKQPTGNKVDSALVELCKRFAMKGYVAVAPDYRMGWNPGETDPGAATEALLKATYRGIQDIRNCIRFLRVNAATYGIDTSMIVVGGQATGGYIALALGTIDRRAEIENNIKFQRGDFTPMVSVDTLGDWNGLGGVAFPGYPYYLNYTGDPAVSADADMIFNYGGAMGDSAWLESNNLPIVSLHVTTDPFAPYHTGDVKVPTTGTTVVPSASGAGVVIPMANMVGVNDKINAAVYTDAYTTKAMELSGNVKNLYPFMVAFPYDGAPWEWWDRTTIQNTNSGSFYGTSIPASGHVADSLAMLTNPSMSAAKGKAYIDTIVNFVAPRIAVQFDLVDFTGIAELNALANASVSTYPNPATSFIGVNASNNTILSSIELMDITGHSLVYEKSINSASYKMENAQLTSGIYFLRVQLKNGGTTTKKIIVQ